MVPMVVCYESKENGGGGGADKQQQQIVLHDSQRILRKLGPFLYPVKYQDEIIKLESYFGSHLGATIRCVLYDALLVPEHYDVLAEWLTVNSSTVEKMLFQTLLKRGTAASGMRRAMRINSDSARHSRTALKDVFAKVSNLLTLPDGTKKEFIMDVSRYEKVGFTAADLSFCALASSIINPPELSRIMPQFDHRVPKDLILLRDELRKTVAGVHVLEMYRSHRIGKECKSHDGSLCENAVLVEPKIVNRDVSMREYVQSIVCKL